VVEIRLAESNEDFEACERMSHSVWGAAERNVVPRELLKTIQLNGGIVQGAFQGDRMVGFVFGFLGIRDGRLRLCSHQLGVDPALRGHGIGIALKLAQRDEVLKRGLDLITWTFDPLEARNAYINLHRLGAIARLYDRDHYGVMEDALNAGLATDRLEAEWWIRQPGSDTLAAAVAAGVKGQAVVMLSVGPDERPERGSLGAADAAVARIQVPRDFQASKRRSLELAQAWRLESRAAFEAAFGVGLVATDFEPDGWYVLTRWSPP
jgi:chorismate synthase